MKRISVSHHGVLFFVLVILAAVVAAARPAVEAPIAALKFDDSSRADLDAEMQDVAALVDEQAEGPLLEDGSGSRGAELAGVQYLADASLPHPPRPPRTKSVLRNNAEAQLAENDEPSEGLQQQPERLNRGHQASSEEANQDYLAEGHVEGEPFEGEYVEEEYVEGDYLGDDHLAGEIVGGGFSSDCEICPDCETCSDCEGASECAAGCHGVGKQHYIPGYMPQHTPYEAWRSYYYFRPYNYMHVPEQQGVAMQNGVDPRLPYSNALFESIYLEVENEDDGPESVLMPMNRGPVPPPPPADLPSFEEPPTP